LFKSCGVTAGLLKRIVNTLKASAESQFDALRGQRSHDHRPGRRSERRGIASHLIAITKVEFEKLLETPGQGANGLRGHSALTLANGVDDAQGEAHRTSNMQTRSIRLTLRHGRTKARTAPTLRQGNACIRSRIYWQL